METVNLLSDNVRLIIAFIFFIICVLSLVYDNLKKEKLSDENIKQKLQQYKINRRK